MVSKIYTESEIKSLVLNQINRIEKLEELKKIRGFATSSSTTITGSATVFTSDLVIGDYIGNTSKGFRRVVTITDDENVTVDAAFLSTLNGEKIKKQSAFNASDATEAFDSAIRETGYSLPVVDDDDIDIKNDWLMKRMGYWFYYHIRQRFLLLIETGDLKGSGITDRLTKILTEEDVKFEKVKMQYPNIFVNAGISFGGLELVIPSGFIENRIGEDIAVRTSDII